MKRIFITGATGFIGQELCLKLAEQGHSVRALYRSESKVRELRKANIELVQGDLLESPDLTEMLRDCDELYHLAAYAEMWAADDTIFHKVNVLATRNLFQAAHEAGVKRIVFTSTAGVLGPSNGDLVTEESGVNGLYFSAYEQSKAEAEAFIAEWESQGMEVIIVNPTRVYGPGLLSVSNGVSRLIEKYLNGNFKVLPGKGSRIGNYCFVDDVVVGHIQAMQLGRDRQRYILGGENCSFRNLLSKVGSLSGKQYRLYSIPSLIIELAARFFLLRARIFGVKPLITPSWAKKFNNYDFLVSSEKAAEELGYQITPLDTGLKETIDWLRKEADPE